MMRIVLYRLLVHTKKTVETIDLSKTITFIYGPVGKGKSTVARLIDYCLGGNLEKTPAIQQEFVSAILYLKLGEYDCTIERSAEDTKKLRVTWSGPHDDIGSLNAPIEPQDAPLLVDDVFSFSDLLYHFCGVSPIKVRKRSRDFESPLIRLSFRDIWRYCFLNQGHLDSSFFRFEDPYRGRKSQDAMRFFTGLYSERLSQIETDLFEAQNDQRAKREAVQQIRNFMEEYSLGSEYELTKQLSDTEEKISLVKVQKQELHKKRTTQIHPTDNLRNQIRMLSKVIANMQTAYYDSQEVINEQKMLRAELITAKIKAERAVQAGQILKNVSISKCPECGTNISSRDMDTQNCRLCGSLKENTNDEDALNLEVIRKDLNNRIDEIEDSIKRREYVLKKTERELDIAQHKKRYMDLQLQEELEDYDSAIIESIRYLDRDIAKLEERLNFLNRLIIMPQAINDLEEQAGAIQGKIDRLRTDLDNERKHLADADENVLVIASTFKQIMLNVKFPGVYEDDRVTIDPRNWKPVIHHNQIVWRFEDIGSGGKKTAFNVCYALALHTVAKEKKLPVPTVLIIDSPTKNISEDEDPELVNSLYKEIYRLIDNESNLTQLILIDSDLIEPDHYEHFSFSKSHMAGTEENPSLISYYVGP